MDKYNTIQYNTVIYTYTHTYTSKYIHVHIPNIMLEFFVPAWNRLPLVTVNQHQISLLYMYRPSYVQLTVEVSFNVSVCLVHCLSASAFVYVYLLSLSKMYAIVGVPQLRIDCVISALILDRRGNSTGRKKHIRAYAHNNTRMHRNKWSVVAHL